MHELISVANTADTYGIKIIYDNHQFHTSSWLNPLNGRGFPSSLFKGDPVRYGYGAGGTVLSADATRWWTDWWNRSIKDTKGNDGWTLQADFLKKIVRAVNNHTSTLGYEILSEPQIHSKDQWEKIKKFNEFMTDELRSVTNKTIAYSIPIPFDLGSPTEMTPANLASLIPANTGNVVFRISLYGNPDSSEYQRAKINTLVRAAHIANIPMYIGEWNKIAHTLTTTGSGVRLFLTDPSKSDINQNDVRLFVKKFKEFGVWGWAYWIWNFVPHKIPNYNLVNFTKSSFETTKYFNYLKNTISSEYGISN